MLALVLASVLLVGEVEVEVQLLDGTLAAGSLVQLTETDVEIRGASLQTIPRPALLTIAAKSPSEPPGDPPAVWVELVDDSRLLATRFTVSASKADIALLGGGGITVPTRSIATVRFKTQNDDVARQWADIQTADTAGDIIVVRKTVADNETGTAIDSLDYLEGVLGDVSDQTVQFTFDGNRVDVPRTKVEGVLYFHPPGRELPDTLCAVTDVFGSRLSAKSIRSEDASLKLDLVSGLAYALPTDELRKIDFSAGRVVFLSDLVPATSEWNAFLETSQTLPSLARLYQPRSDRNFSGGPLRLRVNGRLEDFAKGLAIHSRTELVYRVPDGFRRFQALAGIDDTVHTGGKVRLEIRGDNEVLFDEPVSVGNKPLPIDLDITGVRRLKILVDFGEELDIGDSLHLCNAKVTK